jgi:hypothetical protein
LAAVKWLVFALLLAPPEGRAVEIQRPGEAVTWTLTWQAPPSCPAREQVVAAIRAYLPALDEPPSTAARADLQIRAQLEQVQGEWSAQLISSGREGATERRFSAASCSELSDAIALVAAVALDPVLVSREIDRLAAAAQPEQLEPSELPELPTIRPPDPKPDPTTAMDLSPAPDPRLTLDLSDTDQPSPRNFQIGLRLHGGGGYGPTTTGYAAIGAGLAIFARPWRWALDGGWWLPRALVREQAGGRFQAWRIGTRGCFVPQRGNLEFPLCAGIEAGQILARGLPPAINTRDAAHPWIAASLTPGLAWLITPRLALTAEAALLLPFVNGNFNVGDQALQSLPPVALRSVLAVELRL